MNLLHVLVTILFMHACDMCGAGMGCVQCAHSVPVCVNVIYPAVQAWDVSNVHTAHVQRRRRGMCSVLTQCMHACEY